MRTSNRLVWTVIFVIGLTLQPAFGQSTGNEQRQALEEFGIYPYPSEEEVNDSVFSSEGFVVEPLSTDDIHEDFSNIEDLAWLEPIARAHQVVLIGESHYFQYIRHLRNRVLFALNTFDVYPSLILEDQYSKTPFINFYLSLEDEEEARAFESTLDEGFLLDESAYHLFQHLRRWNKTHPARTIQVGYSDIEHDYSLTFQHILLPYFLSLKQTFSSAGETFPAEIADLSALKRLFKTHSITSSDTLNDAFRPLEEAVALAKERRFIGKYPFITPEYIENVVENLKSTYNAYTQDFFQYRQQAIIRNLTETRFLGKYFKTGKVMIHAGGYHTATHHPNPEGENALWEGSYLTYTFKPTTGKTCSLDVSGMAFSSVLNMKDVDLSTCGHLARTRYGQIVQKIQQAIAQNLLNSEIVYIDDAVEPTESPGTVAFMQRILHLCYQHHNHPLLFQQIPWMNLFEQAKQMPPEYAQDLVALQREWQRYDLNIVVPVSPLIKSIEGINPLSK